MKLGSQLHPPSEITGALQTDPERLRAVVLAAQMAAQARDPSEQDRECGRRFRRGFAVDGNVDRTPFGGVQHGITGQLGNGSTEHSEVVQTPSDDEIQGQSRGIAPKKSSVG